MSESNNFQINSFSNFQINTMEIKILGPGCPKCKTLEKVTREAVAETGIDATIEKVEDIVKIMEYQCNAYSGSCY